ncbi:MAG: NAD(P)/FAD-dependent oxidoreductase [Minisyncoccales bacterium]
MNNNFELIIIGGGPAGLMSGIYASRQKIKTLLITEDFGGLVFKKLGKIYNYLGFPEISGLELIERFKKHFFSNPIEFLKARVVSLKKENNIFHIFLQENKVFFAQSVIIATGSSPRTLKVPGEKEFLGKGVSYCAACDAPLFKKKSVAVIGGGNSGCETALFLSELENEVFLFEREKEINSEEIIKEKILENKRIKIFLNSQLKEIKGKDFVEAIVFQDLTSKKEEELKVQGVFIEVGALPSSQLVKDLVDFNERGEIIVDRLTFQTKTEGLFAVGDVIEGKYKQIITAAGQGAQASLYCYDYLKKIKN